MNLDRLDGLPEAETACNAPAIASKSPGRLTPAQSQAAMHDGPILVLAGAGTGKTKTLTAAVERRIVYAGIPAARILAVTFTNKAANEMRDRIQARLGIGSAPHWLGTFHSLGARQLRYEPEVAGLRHGFVILDAPDSLRLVKRCMTALGLDLRPGGEADAQSPKMLCRAISQMKDNLVTPEHALRYLDAYRAEAARRGEDSDPDSPCITAQVYAEYQRRLLDANTADFGDLLLWPTLAMQNDEAYRQRWAGRFDCLAADEYQDVNAVQYAWLMLLGRDHRRLFIVGDDDQAIFAFRGSDIRYIRSFQRDFPEALQVRLEENFRSTGHILSAANAVISCDRGRLGKTLFTSKALGHPIEIVQFHGPEEEAAAVAGEIARRNAGGVPLEAIAILYRSNLLSRSYEEALLRARIPYQIIGNTGFYQRAEIKDALSLLSLAHEPEGRQFDEAFRRVANVPPRGIGAKAMQAIEAEAERSDQSLLMAARTAALPQAAHQKLLAFVDLAIEAGSDVTMPLADQLSMLLDRSGYRAMLRESRADDAEGRLENLQELLLLAGKFHSVQSLLEHAVLSGQGAELDGSGDGRVKMMTMHKAKGLEFDHVFLPAWESGLFPAVYSDLGEERRLAYVAITRGRQRVTISHCAFRRGYTKQSCFVDDVPREHSVVGWLHDESDVKQRRRLPFVPLPDVGHLRLPETESQDPR